MTQERKSSLDLKKLLGTTLLPLGLSLLFVNVEANLAATGSALSLSGSETDFLPSLALSLFRVVQAYFFDHPRFLHGLGQILLSCWPIILILSGIVFLQNAIKPQLQSRIAAAESSSLGDQS